MAVLTRSGRAAIAAAIKDQATHLAWGLGDPDWDTDKSLALAFQPDDTLDVGFSELSNVVVASQDNVVTYTPGNDYTVDASTGIITRVPAGVIPALAGAQVSFHVGTPSEPIDTVALMAEVGRRRAAEVRYCTPDEAGEIVVPNGRYAASETPTNNLYMAFRYDFADGADATIREVGVHIGTVTDPALPPGQLYFAPAEISDPGILLVLEHLSPIVRSPATRETFEFVVTF